MEPPLIYSIGHSTRSFGELVGLLEEASVDELIDVRHTPRSRIRPHLAEHELFVALGSRGIAYHHSRALGAAQPSRDGSSPNQGWQHPGLRGFADYMGSTAFALAIEDLQRRGRSHVVCMMCAEQHWRRCHRRLICDALVAKGWRVMHLGIGARPCHHELTPFAVISEDRLQDRVVTYPPLDSRLARPRLGSRGLGPLSTAGFV
jgi:uncharacterized protein (DUF488 family)